MLGIVTLGLFVRASAGVAAIASAKTIALMVFFIMFIVLTSVR